VFGDAQIQVIPEDGGLGRYYTVSFKRGGNADLQQLTWSLNGNTYPVDNFKAEDTIYHVLLPIGTTALPVLNYILVDTNSLVKVTNVAQTNGTGKVEITGWDKLSTKTYTVIFEVELSTKAALSDLMVNGVTVDSFHTDTLTYFVEYGYGTTRLSIVSATATQPDARIDYTQINKYPDVAIIKVYAGDTNIQRVYTISFSVEAGDNAFLSDLLVDSVTLAGFDRNVVFYDVLLPHETTTLPVVSATAEDKRATVTITQIEKFEDTAKIQVAAINGDIKEYQVYFAVDGNSNAYASNIFVDGKMVENFNASSRNYNYILSADYAGIPVVTAELADPKASYTVKNAEQIPGQTVIETTAENKRDKFTYRINFTKGTSITSFEDQTTIYIYPNPSSSRINFVLNGTTQTTNLDISTVDGKILGKYTLQEGINPVEIEHLQKGVYFYKVYTEKGILGTGKFIKQ
jgi:NADPH-dependent ferric siderophore reductase